MRVRPCDFGNCSIDRDAIGPSLSMTHVYELIEICCRWRIDRHLGSTSTIAIAVSTLTTDINDADVIADPNSPANQPGNSLRIRLHIRRMLNDVWWRMPERPPDVIAVQLECTERYFGTRDLRQFTTTIGAMSSRLNPSLATLHVSLISLNGARPGKKINKLDTRAIALNRS